MNILITGCNGQLGNEIQLLQQAHRQHTFFNTDVADLDITNPDAIMCFINEHEIDGIVNCAAYTAVDKAESNVEFCSLLNTSAPGYLAEAIEKRNGFLIQISTDYVFDGTAHIPYKETDETCPNSVYGLTKLAGEKEAVTRCCHTMIIRTAWLYSTFGNNFVKTMIKLGQSKDTLGVVFDQIGTPTYAHDLAEAILAIIDKGIIPGIYHFSNEGVTSWYDFSKAIHRIAGITSCRITPLHTEEYPTSANRPNYSVLDKSKIKNAYDIKIPHWEESLNDCIQKLQTQ